MNRQFNICALSVEEISRQFQTVRSGLAAAVGNLPDDGEIGDVCLCGLRILRVEDMEKLQSILGVKEQVAEHAVLDRILWCLVIHCIYRCGALGIVLFRCVL